MISASVVVEGGAGVAPASGRPMTFVEPFLLSNKTSPPEFLRPLPKAAPLVSPRYNGSAPPLNGCRVPPGRKFPPQPDAAAVNFVSKEEEDSPYRGLYPPPPSYHYPGGPYGALYPGHYTPLLPPYSPLQPSCSPPVKPGQSLLRPGKEGSLKHRILTRPPDPPKRHTVAPHNTNFTKGSLIQLASGELRRVEDMRTEDFVSSAEKSPALRLDPSTVVRIQEGSGGTARLTLSYGEHSTQVGGHLSTSSHLLTISRAAWTGPHLAKMRNFVAKYGVPNLATVPTLLLFLSSWRNYTNCLTSPRIVLRVTVRESAPKHRPVHFC
ncbi:hypothetical protein B7P43_G04465 [Cryptotermes secundus]|uniref:AXH domain-containing protein n=1 Tax=Cryptotermes secundus TaxID=105785 RepID=A0A2J7QC58_9NEOP|nr:hypothetical protein B7P43_G04465 [Cryptotermes secundus]